MIILDEQLLGTGLESLIELWYAGSVRYITDLRPATVIKDDNIPPLLHQLSQPTFVTINERDFWRKIASSNRYCIVCFMLPTAKAREISSLLRQLFNHSEFSTKAKRMGKVFHITPNQTIRYYTATPENIIIIRL